MYKFKGVMSISKINSSIHVCATRTSEENSGRKGLLSQGTKKEYSSNDSNDGGRYRGDLPRLQTLKVRLARLENHKWTEDQTSLKSQSRYKVEEGRRKTPPCLDKRSMGEGNRHFIRDCTNTENCKKH